MWLPRALDFKVLYLIKINKCPRTSFKKDLVARVASCATVRNHPTGPRCVPVGCSAKPRQVLQVIAVSRFHFRPVSRGRLQASAYMTGMQPILQGSLREAAARAEAA